MADSPLTYKIFEQTFKENRKTLERVAYYLIGDSEEARDIVGQCFLTLWEKRNEIQQDKVLSYLFISVRNACLDYRRKDTVHKKVYENILLQERGAMEYYTSTIESTDPSTFFRDDIMKICTETLMDLPEEQRETFLMNRFEGLTYKQTAQSLGVGYKRVDKNLQKVMKKLREALKEYLPVVVALIIAAKALLDLPPR